MENAEYIKKHYTASLSPSDENVFDFMAFNVMRVAKNIGPDNSLILKSYVDEILYKTVISEYSKEKKIFEKETTFYESTFKNLSEAFKSIDNEKYAQQIMNRVDTTKTYYGSVDWFDNSCYQDAVILALFAMPIQFVIVNILYKNIYELKDSLICKEENLKNPRKNLNYLIRLQMFLRQITKKLWFKSTPFQCYAFRLLTKRFWNCTGCFAIFIRNI
jgi:hypothetical protein